MVLEATEIWREDLYIPSTLELAAVERENFGQISGPHASFCWI